MAQKNLSAAKNAKNDEFYTQYVDIQKEVNAYVDFDENVFKGKTILLPCDDPEWSNFTKYFAQNFERLGIKKLISTSYAPNSKALPFKTQPTLFESESPEFDITKTLSHGKIFTLFRDKTGDKRIDVNDLEWEYLKGDGDFRSDEILKLRDEADVIITNPPFSLFREFFAWLTNSNKKFLVIGNKSAIGNKEMFPLMQNNEMWVGATSMSVDLLFDIPKESEQQMLASRNIGSTYRIIDGVVKGRSASIWFTNIDHGRRHRPLPLMTMEDNLRFSKHKEISNLQEYPKYDNYDAIEVQFTDAIPSDFEGVMGVPISFLDKYNPDQFEILGSTQRGCHDNVPDFKKYDDYFEMKPDGTPTGSTGGKTNENANLAKNDGKKNYFVNKDGHVVQSAYQRIFIKHRNPVK